MPTRKGDRYTSYGCEWEWLPATDLVHRGRWISTDDSRIAVIPPSGLVETWNVLAPVDGEPVEVEFDEWRPAFHYAATKRKLGAN